MCNSQLTVNLLVILLKQFNNTYFRVFYIVIATHCDPIEGYCTNYFGLNGVLAASGAGLARIVFGETRNVANVVCADFAINATLAVVWDKQVNSG